MLYDTMYLYVAQIEFQCLICSFKIYLQHFATVSVINVYAAAHTHASDV
jgi:hypothetical protein